LEIVRNMREGLEPLHYSMLPPAIYNVYLHPDDMERLREIEPRIVDEARRALDAELESLNRGGLAARIGRGQSKEWLYLVAFSTQPREQLLDLYGKRRRIETDLRSLKRTVQLRHVAAHNESTMEKEPLTDVEAYNLVRAVMALAARRHALSPRQLSFTFVLNVVNARWNRLQTAPDSETYRREVFDLLDAAAQGVHPRREKRRSCPRAVWHHGGSFPARKESQ
jgi:hypothetical protein